ncbi:MAG: hypothetical protein BSOLF_2581 [Candidatus Carbobacillus altaicus]|uniref:Uncharacterized protein n=1 Tax=Candidatus Carbonibacillus altaicus TaxID=2163959 RepID=A0A2R6XXY4_9BACL|nr:MAG: hypothetical protein BSOLF_2581 [Candidatus Carbobacillus altaicus]
MQINILNKKGGLSLYWTFMIPMFLFLALLIFEAAIIIYAKQTADRFMDSAAQAGLATARLIPQGVPVISDGTSRVTRVDLDLSNISIQLDRVTAKKAATETLRRNLTNAGWGIQSGDSTKFVRMNLNNIIAYSLTSGRTDTIIFSKQLDRPRSTANDQDIYVVRGEITVKAPLMASFYQSVFKGNLGIAKELTFPVEGKAQIRYRVGNNISNEFPSIRIR